MGPDRQQKLGSSAARPRRAFTIFELIVALAMISIVASLAVPAFFERSEVTLDNACRILAKDLRLAQARAAFDRMTVRVEFFPDGDGYQIVDGGGIMLPHPYDNGGFDRRYAFNAVFEGVQITQVGSGDELAIEYQPGGLTQDGGHVILNFMEDARIVVVEPGKGEVIVLGGNRRWSDLEDR